MLPLANFLICYPLAHKKAWNFLISYKDWAKEPEVNCTALFCIMKEKQD